MVKASSLRVLFFGTPAFAVPTLDALLLSNHPIVGVVTQPDRPRGRGHRIIDPPVKICAIEANLPILQPATLEDPVVLGQLAALGADLGVVVAYGRVLSDAVLATPRLGLLNVHPSLLPRHRGAAPVHQAVMAGDTETGVTIMRVVKALDAGPILTTVRRRIATDETSVEVERDLAQMGAALLVATVDHLAIGELRETLQNEGAATCAPRLTKEDGLIDWHRQAPHIHNQVRGLYPWPHAYGFLKGQRLIILRSRASSGSSGAVPGTILAAQGNDLSVAAGSGVVHVLELQPEGKRPMQAREFLAGHRVAAGDRFAGAP